MSFGLVMMMPIPWQKTCPNAQCLPWSALPGFSHYPGATVAEQYSNFYNAYSAAAFSTTFRTIGKAAKR